MRIVSYRAGAFAPQTFSIGQILMIDEPFGGAGPADVHPRRVVVSQIEAQPPLLATADQAVPMMIVNVTLCDPSTGRYVGLISIVDGHEFTKIGKE